MQALTSTRLPWNSRSRLQCANVASFDVCCATSITCAKARLPQPDSLILLSQALPRMRCRDGRRHCAAAGAHQDVFCSQNTAGFCLTHRTHLQTSARVWLLHVGEMPFYSNSSSNSSSSAGPQQQQWGRGVPQLLRRSAAWWQRSRWSKRIRRSCQHCSCGRAINLQGCAAACTASASDASAQKYTAVQRCTVAQQELAAEERTCAAATTGLRSLIGHTHSYHLPRAHQRRKTPIFFLFPAGRNGGGATLTGASSSESEFIKHFCALAAAAAAAATAAAGRVSRVSTVTDTPPSNCNPYQHMQSICYRNVACSSSPAPWSMAVPAQTPARALPCARFPASFSG